MTQTASLPARRNLIGGRADETEPGAWSVLVDPATGLPRARAPRSGPAAVDAAVAAASSAFERWRESSPAARAAALLRLADLVERHAQQLTDLEVAETGKPRALTLAEEIAPAADQLRFFAAAARGLEGRAAADYLAGHHSTLRREPVGVCAQITPWNYPLLMAVWKIGPALAAGNTVVLKPAETTPSSSLRLAELAAEALPAGVFNVVCGDRDTGRYLARHPVPALVSLTGSTRAGREVAAAAGLKRLHLELGGNAAAVVFADAAEDTAGAIAEAAYFNAGQDCVAAARVLVHRSRHDAFVHELAQAARSTRTGGPEDPEAFYGPLNNPDQLARVSGLIDRLPEHAELVAGGARVGGKGYFYAPTVVAGVRQRDEIVQQEVFGPVVTVQPFDTEAEAVALANGVAQGLSCSVWTRDHATASRLPARLDFGCVWINTHLRFAAEMPHGGYKESGYGRDLSVYALEDYTRVKHVMSAY